jgi:predicted dehydrogenase
MADGFGFQMKYTVNFERATVEFDLAGDPVLRLIEPGKEPRGIEIAETMGYQLEIKYLVDCIRHNRQPEIITVADAAEALRIIEAEVESVKTGQRVELAAGPT